VRVLFQTNYMVVSECSRRRVKYRHLKRSGWMIWGQFKIARSAIRCVAGADRLHLRISRCHQNTNTSDHVVEIQRRHRVRPKRSCGWKRARLRCPARWLVGVSIRNLLSLAKRRAELGETLAPAFRSRVRSRARWAGHTAPGATPHSSHDAVPSVKPRPMSATEAPPMQSMRFARASVIPRASLFKAA